MPALRLDSTQAGKRRLFSVVCKYLCTGGVSQSFKVAYHLLCWVQQSEQVDQSGSAADTARNLCGIGLDSTPISRSVVPKLSVIALHLAGQHSSVHGKKAANFSAITVALKKARH